MRPRRTLGALAGLALAGLLMVPAATAQALPLGPGQQQICTTTPTPDGYYVEFYSQQGLPGCPDADDVPARPGRSKVITPVPTPPVRFLGCHDEGTGYLAAPGYAVTAINDARSGSCGNRTGAQLLPGDTVVHTPLTGTAMSVCSAGGIPPGYRVVPNSTRSSNGVCGSSGSPGVFSPDDLITIAPGV